MIQNNKTSIEIPQSIHDASNSLNYTLHGDYYFPDLQLPDTDKISLSYYGRMLLNYLPENHLSLYIRLILTGNQRAPGRNQSD